MTDITELAPAMKAAAIDAKELAIIARYSKGRAAAEKFYALANPNNVIALVEALEKAQAKATQQGNIACALFDEVTQLRLHADEKAPELRAQLIEADSELEALRNRIAELESHKAALLKFIRDSCYVFDGADEDISDAYVDAITSGLIPKLESVTACNPPLFWVRVKSDGGYEGPIHDSKLEEVRKKSGEWLPLTLAGGIPELESRTVTDWIEHDGKWRPESLGLDELVYLKTRKQELKIPYPAGKVKGWMNTGGDMDVMAYKLASPQASAVTVKLTDINEYLAEVHDKTLNRALRLLAEGVRAGDVAAMRAAGIKVEVE
ncbi:hypothetical protein [Klebsiella variicola]|uniref:hypothetical protein n=1 Tax=Klebsiella variicola TaxID=244366 RepID=UPI00101BEA56|nr:hypothetical protein [Klebsiella variicola]